MTSMARAAARYDDIDTVPEFAGIRNALAADDWPTAEQLLRELPPDEAAYALEMIADREGIETLLEQAVAADPASACARTALARRCIAIGWGIRTGARAEDVSPEQFEAFRSWLVRAEQLLIDACAADGSFVPAWGARVLTARALEVGATEAARRYDRIRRLSPHDFPAQTHMLQYLLPKWAGSEEQALAFAREAAADAPPGSHNGALVPIVHIERWLDLDAGKPGAAYMAQQAVVDELTGAASRSVLHDDYVGGPLGVQAHSCFAMAFWLAGRNERAAVHFAALGDRATEFPWMYTFDAPAQLGELRDAVLRGAPEERA